MVILFDFCAGVTIWWLIGYAIAYCDEGCFAAKEFDTLTTDNYLVWIF